MMVNDVGGVGNVVNVYMVNDDVDNGVYNCTANDGREREGAYHDHDQQRPTGVQEDGHRQGRQHHQVHGEGALL